MPTCHYCRKSTDPEFEIESCEVEIDVDDNRLLKGFVDLQLVCKQCGEGVAYKPFVIQERIIRQCCGNPWFEVLPETEWASPEESRLTGQPVQYGYSYIVQLHCLTCAETFTQDIYQVYPISEFTPG